MPNEERIKFQWDSYRIFVLPNDAPAVQIQECKRAFFAGAEGLMRVVMSALDPTLEPTANDLKAMEEIQRELSNFAEAVKAGKA
jgi:hypothetical protein